MMEGSGSVRLTNGSVSGGPENLRLRNRNTDIYDYRYFDFILIVGNPHGAIRTGSDRDCVHREREDARLHAPSHHVLLRAGTAISIP
jgi:hypothetical protein